MYRLKNLLLQQFYSLRQMYLNPGYARIVFFLLCCSIASQMAFSQQWHSTAYVPRGRHINSLKFLSPYKILYGGGNEFYGSLQELWTSNNLGLEWEIGIITPPGQPWIKSLAFSDTLQGYAVGDSATILKTEDGAHNWTGIPKPIQNREFHKIIYVTPKIMFIVGGSIPYPEIIIGGGHVDTFQTIIKSTDGGNSWSVMLDRKGYWLNGVAFTDSLHGIAVGDNGNILRTTNGGVNWTTISPPVVRDFYAVYFINANIGYIVGGGHTPVTKRTILRTTNGGNSWSVLTDESGGTLKDITFSSATTGYIVGDSSTVLKTTNAGLNWTKETLPGAGPNESFNCVEFKNDNLGMIGANFGRLHIYTTSELATTYTLDANYVDSFQVKFSAGINTHDEIATYDFTYSMDSTFSSYSNTFYIPENIRTNTLSIKELTITDSFLIPDTTYYYFLKVRTLAGMSYGDTLTFRTTKRRYTFQTLPATAITFSNATLNGITDKLPTAANLSFEYDTSLLFSNAISAVPSIVSDTFFHLILAHLTNLDSNTVYYYRLKGVQNNITYYGGVKTFFTGTVFKTLQTLPASGIIDSTVILNGIIDKFRLPVILSFDYGISLSLENNAPFYPTSFNDTLLHHFSATINNLPPNTQYYFRLKAQTTLGTFYGDILSFRSGLSYTYFYTADATRITANSVQLNARAKGLSTPAALSFEYGLTPSMGSSVIANPSGITDTATYSITANLTGLQPDRFYFFRLKAVSGGITFYGDTKQFYTGSSEIPNWDFQFWKTDTVNIPANWNIFDDGVERTPGNTGNYAIKLTGKTLVSNASIGDGFFGGSPINVIRPPDSLVAYMNYSVDAGDTAGIMLMLKKNGYIISTTYCFVTGNSANSFKRMAYKINYDVPEIPDTVQVFLVPSLTFYIPNTQNNNYLSIDDISFLPDNTTFTNSNFENWFESIVETPLSWFTLKYIGLDTTDPTKNHMVSKVFFEAPDDFAAEISNINWPSIGIINGSLSTNNGIFTSGFDGGFPVKGKHRTLNGYYKFFPANGDTMQIGVVMMKDHQDVGHAFFKASDTVSEFMPFSIPIEYFDDASTVIPDSAVIGIGSSILRNPKAGSRLIIDKLSFDGFVLGIPNTHPDLWELDGLKIYPNPARDILIVETTSASSKPYTVSIYGINGQIVKYATITPGNHNITFNVGELASGSYILSVCSGANIVSKKIFIQK